MTVDDQTSRTRSTAPDPSPPPSPWPPLSPSSSPPSSSPPSSGSSSGEPRPFRAFAPLLVDVVVPTVLYVVLHACGLPPVYALTVAGSATGCAAAVSSWRRRSLDGVGLLVVVEIVVSVVLLLVSRDPRVLLVKPSIYTFVAALYLYATCVVGRPIGYQAATPLATRGDPLRLRAYHAAWDVSPSFRRRERLVTAVFGTALLLEAGLRVLVVLALPAAEIGRALVAGQLPGVALVVGALLVARSQVPALSEVVDREQERLAAEDAAVTVPDRDAPPPAGGRRVPAGAEQDRVR